MKILIAVLLTIFTSHVFANPCGAPLANHSFCYKNDNEEKLMIFRADCSFSYEGKTSGYVHAFNGSWALSGNQLTIDSVAGSGTQTLIFGNDLGSFSAEGFESEVYQLCE